MEYNSKVIKFKLPKGDYFTGMTKYKNCLFVYSQHRIFVIYKGKCPKFVGRFVGDGNKIWEGK
jgi:hypothetical protein